MVYKLPDEASRSIFHNEIRNIEQGLRSLEDLTKYLTTRTDDNHATLVLVKA